MRKTIILLVLFGLTTLVQAQTKITTCSTGNKQISIAAKDLNTTAQVVECTGLYEITVISMGSSNEDNTFSAGSSKGSFISEPLIKAIANRKKNSDVRLDVTMVSIKDKSEKTETYILHIVD